MTKIQSVIIIHVQVSSFYFLSYSQSHCLILWLIVLFFFKSITEQPDFSNHVQIDEKKTSKNAKIIKETLSLSRYL